MLPGVALIAPLVPETEQLLDMGARIGIALVIGFVAQLSLFVLVRRIEAWVEGKGKTRAGQRAHTIGLIFRNLITVLVVGAVALYALGVLGWDVRPLLATAGIAGVSLGFGAQTLVRDVIAGMFIIAEDQFGVGDLIEVDGKPATVEQVTVRSTTLRDVNGFLHFVPNGEMKVVVNRSRGWNQIAVDVPVSIDEDVDRSLDVVRSVAVAMSAETAWRERMFDDVQVWGVEGLSAQEMQIRLVVRAEPGPIVQEVARELRRRLHRALAEAGIRLSALREIVITPLEPPGGRVGTSRAS
jgi:small-conductance mechanosensitive channel